jgi:ABC-2 type transport system permease protein
MSEAPVQGAWRLWWLPVASLLRREVVRFLRRRSRVLGALLTPVVFWVLIGSGLGRSFRVPGVETEVHYMEYFFPGTVILIVLFTAIFSMISVIEDRREGFMQGVLAAPVGRSAIVVGKVLGSTVLAVAQATVFLCLAPLAGVPLTAASLLASIGVLVIVAVGLSGLGFVVAWPMESTQGFHAVMNLFLMPLWLLSGALFPSAGASAWVRWVIALNPVTYAVAALRRALYVSVATPPAHTPSMGLSLGITAVFAVLMIVLASWVVQAKH